MRRRYELSQKQWERSDRFFPHPTHQDRRGRPWQDHRRIFNSILWRLPPRTLSGPKDARPHSPA